MLTQVFFVLLCSPLWDDKIYHHQYLFAYPQRFAIKLRRSLTTQVYCKRRSSILYCKPVAWRLMRLQMRI